MWLCRDADDRRGTWDNIARLHGTRRNDMLDNGDPLARFGLEAIDLLWTLKDIAGKRWLT